MILNQNHDFDFDFKIVLVTDFTDFNFSKSSKSLSMYSVAVQRICCSISRMLWFHQHMVLLLTFYILIILTVLLCS